MANIISPFVPSFLKSALEGNKPKEISYDDVKETNISSTSSFLYDPVGYPIKNTQQLEIDWSKFENHTFFSSAESKVNVAFEQIINGYPFDGSRSEIEKFFEKLTGFEKWVFDSFPKFKGQLHFTGTKFMVDSVGTLGTWIKVKDQAGNLYPELSTNKTGGSILSPGSDKSFTFEAHIFVPEIGNRQQIIFQKTSDSTHGISFFFEPNPTTTDVTAKFVAINNDKYVIASGTLKKGSFNHVCATLNREGSIDHAEFYLNCELTDRSETECKLGDMEIDNADILIGSGSQIKYGSTTFTPVHTFSGSIDELRIFHEIRTQKQQKLFQKKAIYATPELKLYYRFNEPPPPLTTNIFDSVNSIVLDSSGNSLHSLIANFDLHSASVRQNATLDSKSLMIYEKQETYPVLFPAYPDTVSLNQRLILSGADYDRQNPNLITKLVPRHYFQEAEKQDIVNVNTENDDAVQYQGNGIPGQGKLSPTQIIVSFLYIWAKFFDEIKIFLDSFGTLGYLDYAGTDNMPKNFLYDLMKNYGFNFPNLFKDTTIEQYVDAENINEEVATSAFPLKYVQGEILKRVLINMPDVIKSKGTQHSIRSFLRSVGIDPENSLRIREFGGPTTRQLTYAREKKRDYGSMVLFSTSSLPTQALVTTSYLTASRIETGFPPAWGTMIKKNDYYPHGISNRISDSLLTSGSWTAEAIYKFSIKNLKTIPTQSLMRMCVTGSNGDGLIANLVGMFSENDSKLVLYTRSTIAATKRLTMQLPLPALSVFDDSRWNITFGRERNDSFGSLVSSSYFLRAGTQSEGEITWYGSTSSYYYEVTNPVGGEVSVLENNRIIDNSSGTYIAIGSQSFVYSSAKFLNDSFYAPKEARIVDFNGRVSNLRFWSKSLTEIEWKEHVRNYKSRGVQNPLLNYNYVTKLSGAWERLRLETLTKQETRTADANGNITFIDFSQNNLHAQGTGFHTDKPCVIGEIFDHSYLSPYYDEASSAEKIRIRGYLDYDLVKEKPWASPAPVNEIVASERPNDDVRLSIEFSPIDALNRDIVTIFSTYDVIENAIGSPELLYSPDYPDLEKLREVYFNRISSKINFQNFFEFYKWFDRSIGTFIEQLVPRKTKFRGTNFVVESHMLERSKLEYQSNEIYVGESERDRLAANKTVDIVGGLKKI